MKTSDVDTLLAQINALVDNSTGDMHECALEVQRMAQGLPKLVQERDRLREEVTRERSPADRRV